MALLPTTGIRIPSLKQVVALAGDTDTWKGDCHRIALIVAEQIGERHARACYGNYVGPIVKDSRFYPMPFSRHGWVELLDSGLVVDPTRWVFTCEPPSIWVGSSEDYRLGNVVDVAPVDQLPDAMRDWNNPDNVFEVPASLVEEFGSTRVRRAELYSMAHQDPRRFHSNRYRSLTIAIRMWAFIRECGMGAHIPFDLQSYVDAEEKRRKTAHAGLRVPQEGAA